MPQTSASTYSTHHHLLLLLMLLLLLHIERKRLALFPLPLQLRNRCVPLMVLLRNRQLQRLLRAALLGLAKVGRTLPAVSCISAAARRWRRAQRQQQQLQRGLLQRCMRHRFSCRRTFRSWCTRGRPTAACQWHQRHLRHCWGHLLKQLMQRVRRVLVGAHRFCTTGPLCPAGSAGLGSSSCICRPGSKAAAAASAEALRAYASCCGGSSRSPIAADAPTAAAGVV